MEFSSLSFYSRYMRLRLKVEMALTKALANKN